MAYQESKHMRTHAHTIDETSKTDEQWIDIAEHTYLEWERNNTQNKKWWDKFIKFG